MASQRFLDADHRLGHCVPPRSLWPTLFSLPPRGEQLLGRLERYRADARHPTSLPSRRAIFSALILGCPEDPEAIVTLSSHATRRVIPAGRGLGARLQRRPTQVWLPSPISLRLNRLIEHASEQTAQRGSRTTIVVSLMELAVKEDRATWARRFDRVMERPASDAALSIDPVETVLHLKRPKPGPRPLAVP